MTDESCAVCGNHAIGDEVDHLYQPTGGDEALRELVLDWLQEAMAAAEAQKDVGAAGLDALDAIMEAIEEHVIADRFEQARLHSEAQTRPTEEATS